MTVAPDSYPPIDTFEDWLNVPLEVTSPDPRFEVRRARPADFERIYDLVDEVFGVKRPRAEYAWLYLRNPTGTARCWSTIDKETGKLVANSASWPWPTSRGDAPLFGALSGDGVVAAQLQRKRVSEVRLVVSRTHPSRWNEIRFGWMNQNSVHRAHKLGRTGRLKGPLPRRVLYLKGRSRLVRSGWPRGLAVGAGPVFDLVQRLRRNGGSGRVEDVSRFDDRFEAIDRQAMRSRHLWFPRNADFLNWRYGSHPSFEYRSLALLEGERLDAFCVLKLDGPRATLMEFAAPGDSGSRLLAAARGAAIEAGCDRLEVFATPDWNRWTLFASAGFLDRNSIHYLFLRTRGDEQSDLGEWQLMPGDHDRL